jgi:hypothetical protein
MVSFIHSFSAYSQKADTKPCETHWRAENKCVGLFATGCHTRGKLPTWVFSRQLVSVQIPEWSTEFSWGGRVMQSIAVHKLCQTQKLPSQVCTLRGRILLCILRRRRPGPHHIHVGQLSKTGTDPGWLSWRFSGVHTHGSWHHQRTIILRNLKKNQAANFIRSVPFRFFHETCWFVTIFNLD